MRLTTTRCSGVAVTVAESMSFWVRDEARSGWLSCGGPVGATLNKYCGGHRGAVHTLAAGTARSHWRDRSAPEREIAIMSPASILAAAVLVLVIVWAALTVPGGPRPSLSQHH